MAAGALLSLDTQLSEFLHATAQPYFPRAALIFLEISADFRLFFPAALAAFLLQSPPWPLLVPLLLGFLLDLASVGLLKILFRRNRPHYNRGMIAAVSADHFSFPSGHSSRVFVVAALFHLSGSDFSSSSAAAVWAWAAVTSASRVFLGRHFATDVLAGACLGVFEGLFAYRYLNRELLVKLKF